MNEPGLTGDPPGAFPGGRIDAIDAWLVAWATSALDGAAVHLGPPGPPPDGSGANLHLFDLVHRHGRVPEGLELHYLVTTWAENPALAHRMLLALLGAGAGQPPLRAVVAPQPPGRWTEFGLAPRPSFVLAVPLRAAAPAAVPRPTVREPLVVRLSTVGGGA